MNFLEKEAEIKFNLFQFEIWLRPKHDPGLTYAGSFIVHYVESLVYLELYQTTIYIFTLFLCMFNSWLYFWKARQLNLNDEI